MNKLKHPDYIKIMHKIRSAWKQTQLDSLAELIYRYSTEHNDAEALWSAMADRLYEIDPYAEVSDPIEEAPAKFCRP